MRASGQWSTSHKNGAVLVHSCYYIHHHQDILLCVLVPIKTEATGSIPEQPTQCSDSNCWRKGIPSSNVWETKSNLCLAELVWCPGRPLNRGALHSPATSCILLQPGHATTIWGSLWRGWSEAPSLQRVCPWWWGRRSSSFISHSSHFWGRRLN